LLASGSQVRNASASSSRPALDPASAASAGWASRNRAAHRSDAPPAAPRRPARAGRHPADT
jgi:hypothetical protein